MYQFFLLKMKKKALSCKENPIDDTHSSVQDNIGSSKTDQKLYINTEQVTKDNSELIIIELEFFKIKKEKIDQYCKGMWTYRWVCLCGSTNYWGCESQSSKTEEKQR